MVEPFDGCQFDDVKSDDAASTGNDAAQHIHALAVAQTLWFRRSCGRHYRWVEGVDVEGDVDAIAQAVDDALDPVASVLAAPDAACKERVDAVTPNELGFFSAERADANLHNAGWRHNLRHTCHCTCVGEGSAVVLHPQIRVRIELQHAQRVKALCVRLDERNADSVLTANADAELARIEERCCALFDAVECSRKREPAETEWFDRGNAKLKAKFTVEFLVVELRVVAGAEEFSRSVSSAFAVADGPFEGKWNDDDASSVSAIGSVESEEVFVNG